MVLEDPLNGFEQVGAQRQRALEGSLALPEEPGQSLVPHTLCEGRHRAEGEEREVGERRR